MDVKDTVIPLSGRISLRMLDRRGTCVYRYDSPNTITYLAPLVLLDLITQGWAGTNSGVFPGNIQNPMGDHPASAARGFAAAVSSVHDPRRNQVAYITVGTSDSIATRADTSVAQWPHGNADQTLASSEVRDVHYTNNGELQFVALFDANKANVPSGGLPITEVGLFTRGYDRRLADADGDPNAATITAGVPGAGSRMVARQIHAPVSKTNEFQLEYTWTVLFS